MTEESINLAIQEADRFLRAAKKAKLRIRDDKFALISGSKENGAAKRASLDLTRALAEMRSP